jgi:hypothetical protein
MSWSALKCFPLNFKPPLDFVTGPLEAVYKGLGSQGKCDRMGKRKEKRTGSREG